MKRKLLTVLLAVVMVFGVFGLTACGGSNPDQDYNYYGIKYELEDVRIQAATFQGVYKMFTTPGSFLLYVDSEGEGAADRFAAINDLANEWDVTIYHFNPDLAGGFAAGKGPSANILTSAISGDGIKTVQKTLESISGKKYTELKDNALWGIKGADSTVSNGAVKYNGKLSAQVAYAADADYSDALACTEKFPSYGDKKDVNRYVLDVINTINLFGDARLHMYNDDNGVDALKDEKTDLYVTVANFGMFEHLLLNNEGYFPVFFGGTWCPNTQAIAKATNDIAKDYGIEKIYFFDPRLEDGTKVDAVKDGAIVENSAYLASGLNTRNTDADNNWKALITKDSKTGAITADGQMTEFVKEAKKVLAAATVTTKNAGYKDTVKAKYTAEEIAAIGNNALFAAANEVKDTKPAGQKAGEEKTVLELVKAGYTMEAWAAITGSVDAEEVYAFNYAGGASDPAYLAAVEAAEKAAEAKELANKVTIAKAILSKAGKSSVEIAAIEGNALIAAAAATDDTEKDGQKVEGKISVASIKADAEKVYKASKENYGYLYAAFLDSYLKFEDGSSYASMWNVGVQLLIGDKVYTKMCVPNIMMFNGEGEGQAKLAALAEAEYSFAEVNKEGTAQNIAWTSAVKAVFDANPYAKYAPVMVAEAAPEASAPAASAPAAGAGDAGGC